MTNPTNRKRWRPRFSIRVLLIVVTLACAYLACWGPTKNQGVKDVIAKAHSRMASEDFHVFATLPPSPFCPLIIETREMMLLTNRQFSEHRRYYFWFFGYVVKLYERKL